MSFLLGREVGGPGGGTEQEVGGGFVISFVCVGLRVFCSICRVCMLASVCVTRKSVCGCLFVSPLLLKVVLVIL